MSFLDFGIVDCHVAAERVPNFECARSELVATEERVSSI
jgi:hypothetical protein